MGSMVKITLLSLTAFTIFCLAGFVASSLVPAMYDSLIASTAVFGISFVSLAGGVLKIWYSIFG